MLKTQVLYKKMPPNAKAITTKNFDDSYTIFINSNISLEEQKTALRNEMKQIKKDDSFSSLPSIELEFFLENQEKDNNIVNYLNSISYGKNIGDIETIYVIDKLKELTKKFPQTQEITLINSEFLLDIIQKEEIALKYIALPNQFKGIYIKKDDEKPLIILDENLNTQENETLHRSILAEQIGHHFTKTSELYCAANYPFWQGFSPERQTQALEWAAFKLIPYNRLYYAIRNKKINLIEDLAKYFMVTNELMMFRLSYLNDLSFLDLDELNNL